RSLFLRIRDNLIGLAFVGSLVITSCFAVSFLCLADEFGSLVFHIAPDEPPSLLSVCFTLSIIRTILARHCVIFRRACLQLPGIPFLIPRRVPRAQTGHRGHARHRQASHTPRFSAPTPQRRPKKPARPGQRPRTWRTVLK